MTKPMTKLSHPAESAPAVSVSTPSPGHSSSTSEERTIGLVRGTRDWMPDDLAAIERLEQVLLEEFHRAGYRALRTPVLEFTELHERKSGAGVVSKLYEVGDERISGGLGRVCLRPELTAGIVRAYSALETTPPLPWRVCHVGPVFRHEAPSTQRWREFEQVGVELLGGGGPIVDAEVVWLADHALRRLGAPAAIIRLGDVGLTLEMIEQSGLPQPLRWALVERLSKAAAEGNNLRSLEQTLDQFASWVHDPDAELATVPLSADAQDDPGLDRLFRTLVTTFTGRRTGYQILHRLRRKWDLGHTLRDRVDRIREQIHELAEFSGPATEVLSRLETQFEQAAPRSIHALKGLVESLAAYGIDADRIELDLGYGRGIGFYSRMVFDLVVPTPQGERIEVCGGGRYDGLARVLGCPGDRDDRGVGFAFGLERLSQALHACGARPPLVRLAMGTLVVPAGPDGDDVAAAIHHALKLREQGAIAVLETGLAAGQARAHAQALGLGWLAIARAGASLVDAQVESIAVDIGAHSTP